MFDQKAVNERIIEYAKKIEIKDTELAKQFGVKKQFVQEWKENINVIPPKRLIEFLDKHPELNIRWFLFGEGNMYYKEPNSSSETMEILKDKKYNTTGSELDKVYEPQQEFKNLQELLAEKDKRIEDKNYEIKRLESHIETLKALIESLKK